MAGYHIGVVALICSVLLVLPSWSESNQSNDDDDNNSTMVNNDETPIIEELRSNTGEPHGQTKKRTKKKKNKSKNKKENKNKEKNKYKNNSTRNGRACTGTNSDWRCCSKNSPCQEKQGHCKRNSDCAGSLICGKNNCKDFNPWANKWANCCIKKNYNYCGIENRNRIIGGSETGEHQYPWMVRLPMRCGGSLITDRRILTAKHCVTPNPHQWIWSLVKISVHNQYGSPNDYQQYLIQRIIWPRGNDHDIAMIILDDFIKPNLFEKNIGRVCLPPSSNLDFTGQVATALGWGMTHYLSSQSPVLKHVELTVSREEKNFLYTKVRDSITGALTDGCAGDSGGPLLYRNKKSGRWVIIGTLTGAGYDCRTNQINGEGTWNKVTAHLDWIRRNMY